MFGRLILLLTVVPAAELFVMIAVHRWLADRVGGGNSLLISLGMILGTGIVGAWLARAQGLLVLRELFQRLATGKSPDRVLLDGVLVVAGGALLLTPGYLTDLVGISLLIPGTRGLWRRVLAAWTRRKLGRIGFGVFAPNRGGPIREGKPGSPGANDVVLDVTPEAGQNSPSDSPGTSDPALGSPPVTDQARRGSG